MRIKKRFLGFLLTLALVLGLFPGMSLTAYATTETYSNLVPIGSEDATALTAKQVTFNGYKWYIIADNSTAVNADTVTLLAAESFGESQFGSSNDYSNSTVKGYLEKIVTGTAGEGKPNFADVTDAIVTNTDAGGKLYLLSEAEATLPGNVKQFYSEWWLRSPGNGDRSAKFVDGRSGRVYGDYVTFEFGVRPALKLDLSKVTFASVNLSGGANATSSGASSITNTFFLNNTVPAMTDVTYTANEGCTFPETSDLYKETNGITVARTSDTEITVSGTPTGVANITIPDAMLSKPTVTKGPTAKSLTYTGTAQELVTAGEATGGTMQYAIGTDAITAPTTGYTTSIPTATNAGTYYVWYKVVGDDNHTDSEPDCVTVTIEEQKQNKDEAVANVIDLINKLPSPSEVTANDKEQIEAARAAYDALTDEQKSQISEETLKKLTDIEASLAEVLKNTGDTQQNPDGSKTVTKENADGKTISVTNYSKTDEQISQFVFKKANGTKLDLKNVNSKSLKTVVVPATVKSNGKTYKVTRIRKGFLKNCKQATKVDIGKNINTIDKNAFNYGKKVKTVIIRGKLKKVGKGAFKKTKKNMTIEVKTGAKNFEKNKKLLVKSGLPKNAKVKREKNKK
ncbi:Leucine rich repeat-containing protein [Butyrivibrio sp. ob235]|uniref:leucine-rich repeat protein n=1 Tax=Butyrivibrio sp. ob235 TaxID=1761780 RepID=UPI0008B9FDE0|nr:leucine-rich repeat protein [Butyrivibrio sp. ob235]SEK35195.1 Leucine rich repeat-containing protein [Butyrivibrio sp. ob235]